MNRARRNAGGSRSGKAKVTNVSGAKGIYGSRVAKTGPSLKGGQVRCPVCRNATVLVNSGHLRKHRDLFGADCYNRRAPEGLDGAA